MRLSIVIPSYNQGHLIHQTFESILQQPAGLDLEVIVMDGGSTDSTGEVVKRYRPQFVARKIAFFYTSERDHGQSDAINKGSAVATGELLTYLNSDDYYQPQVLGNVIDEFTTHPRVQWGYGGWRFVDLEGHLYSVVQPKRYSHRRLLTLCTIGQPSCFYRREFFNRMGAVNQELHLSMDYDLWLRMAAACDPLIIPTAVANMRYYMQTKSATRNMSHLQESFALQRKYSRGLMIRLEQIYYFLRSWAVIVTKLDINHRIERVRQRALQSASASTN